MLRKSLIQFSVVGLCCVPSLFFTWGQTVVEVMKIMVTFSKVPCIHCCTQCPDPAAGHHRPTPLPETPGHSQASLGQSLLGSLLLSPGSWCTQSFVCALQESVSLVLCEFWWLHGGVNGDLLPRGLMPYPRLLPRAPAPAAVHCTSTGDPQTQFCLSLCGVSGSWYAQGLFEPSEHLWHIKLKSDRLYSLKPKMQKLYTVIKNKTRSCLWLRS